MSGRDYNYCSECDAFLPGEGHKPMCTLLETLKLVGTELTLLLNGECTFDTIECALTAVNAAIRTAEGRE